MKFVWFLCLTPYTYCCLLSSRDGLNFYAQILYFFGTYQQVANGSNCCNRSIANLHQDDMKKRMNLSYSSNRPGAK